MNDDLNTGPVLLVYIYWSIYCSQFSSSNNRLYYAYRYFYSNDKHQIE